MNDHERPPVGGLFPATTNFLISPNDSHFVVGDNATNSHDCRDFGPLPRQSIVGKVTRIYWPPSRIGDLR